MHRSFVKSWSTYLKYSSPQSHPEKAKRTHKNMKRKINVTMHSDKKNLLSFR